MSLGLFVSLATSVGVLPSDHDLLEGLVEVSPSLGSFACVQFFLR
jgi:hypothetical protein